MGKKQTISIVILAILIVACIAGIFVIKNKKDEPVVATNDATATKAVDNDTDDDSDNEPAQTTEPSTESQPPVLDEDGNPLEVVNPSTMPPLENYDYITNGKVWVNTLGEIQVDYDDGTSEILWSPYVDPDELANVKEDGEEEPLTPQDKFSTPATFTAEDKILAVLDDDGNITGYLDSSDEGYQEAYKVAFAYECTLYEKPDAEYTRKRCEKANELSEVPTFTEEEIIERVNNCSSAPTEELVNFTLVSACVNKDKTNYGIVYTVSYNSSIESTQSLISGVEIIKINNKWVIKDGFSSNIESFLRNVIKESKYN